MSNADDEFQAAILNEEWAKAQLIVNKLWLDSMLYLTTKTSPELKELNYINVTVDTGDGEYILAFMHTRGEKLKLKPTSKTGDL